jgi:hypothetical protein
MAINAEGSFVDPDGTVRHFGRHAFVALAMDLDRCFVCGVASHQSDRSDFNVDADTAVIDSSSRFAAQGGQWVPSTTLVRAIHDAALGRRKCPRL